MLASVPVVPPSSPSSPTSTGGAGLASRVLLELGLKPVVRELHSPASIASARERWEARSLACAVGAPVREDAGTQAMLTDTDTVHTIRPLDRHPIVARAAALGGPLARRVLLDPGSPFYTWLCERYGADQAPLVGVRPPRDAVRERQTLYISHERELARRARDLDRMGADAADDADSRALGALLGYPPCCVDAFCALDRRWPNRLPISASASRTKVFQPRLNNLALGRFAWIAHFPCRYDCEASLDLADAAAEAVAATDASLVARADGDLGLPRLYRDDASQAVLAGARWTGPGRIAFEAVSGLEGSRADAWDDLIGADALRLTRDGVVFTCRGQEVRLSEPPLALPFGLGAAPEPSR